MKVAVAAAGLALALATPAPALAFDAPGPRWPGHTIRFHETLPKSWNTTIERAVQTWNTSGVRVRLKKVPAARAQVVVGYGPTGGGAGLATIGRRTGAFLRVEPLLYRPLRKRDRATAAIVLAHEFGHVMGLDHSGSRGCRLMAARPLSFCPDPPHPWLQNCRWLSRDDIRGALRLYGGRDRRSASRWCLREPAPPALDVLFGQTGIGWRPPKVLPGTRVRLLVYAAGRCTGDTAAPLLATVEKRVAAGRWRARGPACVEVALVNKYGLAGPATTGSVG